MVETTLLTYLVTHILPSGGETTLLTYLVTHGEHILPSGGETTLLTYLVTHGESTYSPVVVRPPYSHTW